MHKYNTAKYWLFSWNRVHSISKLVLNSFSLCLTTMFCSYLGCFSLPLQLSLPRWVVRVDAFMKFWRLTMHHMVHFHLFLYAFIGVVFLVIFCIICWSKANLLDHYSQLFNSRVVSCFFLLGYRQVSILKEDF